MKKEKTIRTYQRRTKTGKVVTVKQHTAKYDAAEALKEAAKKKGAGDELESLKEKPQTKPSKEVAPKDDALGFTADEYKAWYHWDQDADPKNKSALKVEKALKAKMGAKGYKKYFDEMSDSYSSRGHNKAYKALDAEATVPKKDAKTPKSSDSSLKVGSSIQMGNSTSLGKGKKETFKVLAVQKTNKQDRELGNTEAAWVQRKDGSVTLALKDSEKGWMYDDTWTDFTDRKHPYAKSLEAAGYSFKKAQGKGGKYWEVSKGKETKVDSSEYGKAPKHLGMTQQEWNDWMDGGAGYKSADKKAKAHLEKLYGKEGAKAIRKKYEGDGSNKYIDLVSKATADKKVLSEIGGGSKESPKSKGFSVKEYRTQISSMTPAQLKKELQGLIDKNGGTVNRGNSTGKKISEIMKLQKAQKLSKPFKHTDGGTSVEYDAAYAKMNRLIAKHGGVPKKDHKDYAKYKEAEKYVNDFKAGKVGGTAKEVSPKVAKETKKLTERILGKKTPRRGSKAAYEAAQKAKASLTSYVDASPYKRILKSMNTYGGQVNKNELIGKLVKKGLSHAEASKIAGQFATKVKTEFTKSRQYRPGAK